MTGFDRISHHTSQGNVWDCFALSVAACLQILYLTRECNLQCRSRHHGGDWQREAGTSARELAQHDFERSRGRDRRGFEKELRDEHRNGELDVRELKGGEGCSAVLLLMPVLLCAGKDAKPIQGSPAEKEAVQQPPGSDHGWQKSG